MDVAPRAANETNLISAPQRISPTKMVGQAENQEIGRMSAKNGEKSRFQINRKRTVLRRARIRALVTAATAGKKPAHAKARPAKA
jgi:hypothetical protein